MGATIKAREIAACLVLVLVAGACSSGENSLESLDETNPAATDRSTDLDSQLQIPDPLELIIDEDPDSPIAASVIFEEGDHPVERLDFLGPKPSTNLPPTTAVVHMKDSDEAFRIDLDAEGQPSVMYLGDVGELRFSFAGTTMTAEFVAPDGSTSTEDFALTNDDGELQSMKAPSDDWDVSGVRAAFRNAAVDVNRAVFLDVSVWTPDGELPGNLTAPFLHSEGCNTTRSSVTFTCSRVGARLIESRGDLRVYQLAMTHAASAVVQGLDASIWPSAQACEAALGNDWWINAPVTAGLEVSSVTLGTALLSWMAASPEVAAASVAASTAFLPAVAIAGTVAVSFWAGNWVGEQLWQGGEGTCERIKRRVAAMNMLGATIGDIAFTIEVCVPPVEGWRIKPQCQDIGPYQPFSTETQTTAGDAGSLDRNRLPPVDFVITPAPGSITGTVVDADSGDPIAGAVVTGVPAGSTVTDESGQFTFGDAPVGTHTITVAAEGFSEGSKPIKVESEVDILVTFALDRKEEEFPWKFVGTAEIIRTMDHPFEAGGSPLVSTSPVLVEITLHDDGTVEMIRDYSGATMWVNDCVDKKVKSRPWAGESVLTTQGTHANGTFAITFRPESDVTGTYTSTEIRGEGVWNFTYDACDDGTLETLTETLSFGGLPRVHDTP